jgi:hypothetical protein
MSRSPADVEGLLRQALAPVDPPEGLSQRLEATLTSITEIAAEELESWELSAMRDPRNWVRPVAAIVVGTSAGIILVLIRVRRRPAPRGLAKTRAAAQQRIRELGLETRRLGSQTRRLISRRD